MYSHRPELASVPDRSRIGKVRYDKGIGVMDTTLVGPCSLPR